MEHLQRFATLHSGAMNTKIQVVHSDFGVLTLSFNRLHSAPE